MEMEMYVRREKRKLKLQDPKKAWENLETSNARYFSCFFDN